MNRRYALWFLMLCLAPLLVACGHPWKIAREAVPNPFYGQGRFGVVPVTFHGLEVGDGTEADWMAEKDEEQRRSWQADKAAMNHEFAEALMEHAASEGVIIVKATSAADAPFFIRPNVTFYEPGIFTGVFNKATVVKMTVRITDPAGLVLDEVLFETKVPAALTNPSSGGRARTAASQLGKLVAKYVVHRTQGGD